MCRRVQGCFVAVAVALAAPVAAASPRFDEASRLFADERWEPAALALDDVRRSGLPVEREIAQYELGIALYRMQLAQASYAVFSAIVDQPTHARYGPTFLWLARLAIELPEPAEVAERIERYGPDELARLDTPSQRDAFWQLEYLIGKSKYANGQYEAALRAFEQVGSASRSYLPSRFFVGVSQVQLRRPAPAMQAFQQALAVPNDGTPEGARLRDLARISMARTLYSDSIRLAPDGTPTLDGQKLQAALGWWGQIDRSSELWLDALSESAWAHFMSRDDARALGNIHTFDAPYFSNAYYPESEVLRSLIYFANCQYEDAAVVALGFQRKYLPMEAELDRVTGGVSGGNQDERFLKLLADLRADRAGISASVKPVVQRALADRQLLRKVEYVAFIDAERERVTKLSPAFRASTLGADVGDALQLGRDLAVRDAAELGRGHLRRARAELEAQLRNDAGVLVAVATALRDAHPTETAKVTLVSDPEHVTWPFDGEFWRDELGSYRQTVASRCAR